MTGVELRPGDVVHVAAEHRRYREEPVTLRVTRIREDLLRYYDDQWLWLEGYEVLPGGADGQWLQILARVGALPGSATGGTPAPTAESAPRMPETLAPNAPRPPARRTGHGTVYGPSGGYPMTRPDTRSAGADPAYVPRPATQPIPAASSTTYGAGSPGTGYGAAASYSGGPAYSGGGAAYGSGYQAGGSAQGGNYSSGTWRA